MPGSLLDSQPATLEPLDPDEQGIVVVLGGQPAVDADAIITQFGLLAGRR